MQIVGNQEACTLLQKSMDIALSAQQTAPSFFVLAGPAHVGKATMVQSIVDERLGQHKVYDFLHVKDLSAQLGKKHALKVSLSDDKKKQVITLEDESTYQDIGTREISQWLQQSSFGKYKIVLIENIERMTIQAANAFLKTAEEPLPNKVIIATTSHSAQVLDTIMSRAFTLRFTALTDTQMQQFAKDQSIFVDNQKLQEFSIRMAMGRPGVLLQLQKLFHHNEELVNTFVSTVDLLSEEDRIHQKHKQLTDIYQTGMLDQFLDGRIAYAVGHDKLQQSQQWLQVKKMLQSNVNIENLLLYGVL